MAEEMKGRVIGGEGREAELDGGFFGGYVKPSNHVENRRDRRLPENQNGKRKVVEIVRERNGNSLPAVFGSEGAALSWIKARVAQGTVVNADDGARENRVVVLLKDGLALRGEPSVGNPRSGVAREAETTLDERARLHV